MAVINITLTINTGSYTIPQTVNFLADEWAYPATVVNEAGDTVVNPQTKAQFAVARTAQLVQDAIRSAVVKQALADARTAANTAANTITVTG